MRMMFLCISVAAVLLIYTRYKEDWIAIPAYIFSAYSLSMVCARVGLLAGHTKEDVQSIIEKVSLAHRYFSDVSFKLHISLYDGTAQAPSAATLLTKTEKVFIDKIYAA